ncbi:hypothetical protein [Halalkalibacter alkalisediminis]|uniref:Helix-turn-helix domain-containing protein n=1 Tax=Halalkalibacter alkalisediminis TaxID=935616 RepID=A0ABV6NKB7_9BACI|nr:hypothetical protein [Halalkalibacter alkalisediminis]
MQSGHINQFAHLSQFNSVKDFNQSIRAALQVHGHHFTEGQRIALLTLIQYSVKVHGVCNAKICQLVRATHKDQEGVSRTTFERMLRKGKSLGLFSVHGTTRAKKGGDSHNVYVFNRFDVASPPQLTERPLTQKPSNPSVQAEKKGPEAKEHKAIKNNKDQELRPITSESLDYTFVPSYVPTEFVKAVKPFFKTTKEICALWDRAIMAHRSGNYRTPIETFLPTIIQAFRATVYRYKQNRIKTSFIQYFYGTVATKLRFENYTIVAQEQQWGSWMDNGFSEDMRIGPSSHS